MDVHDGCPLGPEAETFTRRLRELESKMEGHLGSCSLRNKSTEEWRSEMKERLEHTEVVVDALRQQAAKWLGAIAVLAFFGSLFGGAIAAEIFKHKP